MNEPVPLLDQSAIQPRPFPGLRRKGARSRGGFTMVELLVVIVIIGILAALTFPVLSKAQSTARKASCLNNFKQLTLAWTIYANDNREFLVNNDTRSDALCGPEAWVCSGNEPGVAHWTGNARVDTNDLGVVHGSLFAYSSESALYHCPADQSQCTRAPGLQRFRSVSISIGMNWHQENPTNGSFVKLTDVVQPSPHWASVFVDEAANSIDNNAIGIYGSAPVSGRTNSAPNTVDSDKYWNVPANRHNNGCVLSFADGHAEWWRWLDPWIAAANNLPDPLSSDNQNAPARDITSSADDRDLQRLRLTAPAVQDE